MTPYGGRGFHESEAEVIEHTICEIVLACIVYVLIMVFIGIPIFTVAIAIAAFKEFREWISKEDK